MRIAFESRLAAVGRNMVIWSIIEQGNSHCIRGKFEQTMEHLITCFVCHNDTSYCSTEDLNKTLDNAVTVAKFQSNYIWFLSLDTIKKKKKAFLCLDMEAGCEKCMVTSRLQARD